ncbi:hypothetical protein NBRC10512_003816 [Rhodotorula toruloides]|uniref:Dolichyl-diphosphooligosaccharide--protein glycosyltransferase subunit 1 n=2 Tax=Rhodotorula toruloides TaxID=5286 RepID=A0A061B6L9_RHOTO|nr:oligosaccharyltransferase complex subunit alpha (ribophorin I) [Rhodotorula toruloides NP11]EMS20044.1 oligosaccharyltransferase complex subunit alpha (ribophorin I) [Rhodotorula toruloides NP11]CDR45556.1 RHTO0S11e01948g1_1 [Rhodotorula toruloides]
MRLLALGWTALAATAALAQFASSQHIFSYPSLPPTSWQPITLSSTIELGGSLTRSQAVYTLQKDLQSDVKGDKWVVGVRQGGKAEGWVEAVEGKGGARRRVEMVAVGSDDTTTYYSISLQPPHSSDKTTLTLSVVLPHSSHPHPQTLPQTADSIYMLWTGDLLAPLHGLTSEQKSRLEEVKVRVKTPTPRVVDVKSPEGFKVHQQQGSATITFTSQGKIAEMGEQLATIHYQQPEAVASIRKLDRIVELSHWGANMAVQDNIDLFNAGPALEGQFARIDYQKMMMHRRHGATALSALSIVLPPSTHSPYYYDLVGNVSTSRFRSPKTHSALLPSQQKRSPAVLELQPRYPLMGGWNYSFTIGYDLPLGEFVRMRKGGRYVAAVPFLTPIRDVAVDDVRVEIRLPEGARDISVHPPFPLASLSLPPSTPLPLFSRIPTIKEGGNVAWTYLDSTGRPTVVMTKQGCTDRHGGEVYIEYTLPPAVDFFQKPLACAAVLSSLFLVVIVAKRVTFGIAEK